MAVTSQVTTNVAVEPAGNAGEISRPAPCKRPILIVPGHILIAVEEQETDVQLKPATAGSNSVTPGAAIGPKLATVMV